MEITKTCECFCPHCHKEMCGTNLNGAICPHCNKYCGCCCKAKGQLQKENEEIKTAIEHAMDVAIDQFKFIMDMNKNFAYPKSTEKTIEILEKEGKENLKKL